MPVNLKRVLTVGGLVLLLVISFNALRFTRHLVLSNYYLRDDRETAAAHMYGAVRIKPSVLPVFERHARSLPVNHILKRAISLKHFDGEDILSRWNTPRLGVEAFKQRFGTNVYFNYLFFPADFYRRKKARWRHLDQVALELLADPGFNTLSLEIFPKIEPGLDAAFLAGVEEYCRWRGNGALADYFEKAAQGAGADTPGKTVPAAPEYSLSRQHLLAVLKKTHRTFRKNKEGHFPLEPVLEETFGSPEAWPQSWYFSHMANRSPFGPGSFVMGQDSLKRNRCLRLMGFYAQKGQNPSRPRAGVRFRKQVPVGNCAYVFSFDYLTRTGKEEPSFYLWKTLGEKRLPPTGGVWKKAVFLVDNSSNRLRVLNPLVRMWGTGTVWLDNLALEKITAPGFAPECEKKSKEPMVFALENAK